MSKRIKLPGRAESAEMGGIVTGASEILDDSRGKTQMVVNNELEAAILALGEGKQNKLTFDNTPTEDSTNPVTSGGVYAAEKILSDAIEAILLLIPSAASALNKLVDMQTLNSSIATATASFKGTYNLVSDLHLTVDATHAQIEAALDALSLDADNNDYCFVQVPNTDTAPTEIKKTERYKFNGTGWAYEYDLNNSGFTSAQWNAINSGITTLLVSKLGALPTNSELVQALAAKQDKLTFDNAPAAGSNNPVKSGGIYTRNAEIVGLINALDQAKQDVLTFDNTPTEGSSNPVKSGGVYLAISAVQATIVALDAAKQDKLTFDTMPTLGSTNPVTSSGIKTELNRIDGDITVLDNLYRALTQSSLVIVQPSDTWPVASPDAYTIYRVIDRVNTPPQYYSDYMFSGSTPVLMAQYNNAIDDVPTAGSDNLVKSGGVYEHTADSIESVVTDYKKTLPLPFTLISGKYVNPNSGLVENLSSYSCTNFMTVFGGDSYLLEWSPACHALGCFFDSNQQYITGSGIDTADEATSIQVTAPSNAVYFRFSGVTASMAAFVMTNASADVRLNEEVGVSASQVEKLPYRLESIVPNIMDFDTIIPVIAQQNKYIQPQDGEIYNVNGFSVTDYISVSGGFDYIFRKADFLYGAWYDESKNYIDDGGIQVDHATLDEDIIITSPATARYLRISTKTTAFGTFNILTTGEGEAYLSDYIKVKESNIKATSSVTTIRVNPSGGGDFTTLSAAFASITDSSPTKKYIVEFYGDGSEYDTLIDKPFVSGQIGLVVPPFTKLVGIGGKEKCILVRRLTNVDVNDSLLNLHQTSEIDGFTLIAENTRYCVHDDFYINSELNLMGYEAVRRNCDCYATNTYYKSVWGAGTRSGVKWKFENCKFKHYNVSDKCDFTSHNNVGFTNPSQITFVNCRFASPDGSRFGSLNTNANGIENYVFYYGCQISKISIIEEDAQSYGSGILFKVSGYANNLKTGSPDITIINTDGRDYSNNIDMI